MTSFFSRYIYAGLLKLTCFFIVTAVALFFCVNSAFSNPAPDETSKFDIPLNELKRPVKSGATYDIPLTDIKRSTKKKPTKKVPEQAPRTKYDLTKKVLKPQKPLKDPATWGTLDSVRQTDDGIRFDIDDLTEKFKLLLEPGNKKVILQFTGLHYLLEEVKHPLGRNGFVQARIGQHPDGVWVVLDTEDTALPEFEVRQDSEGITLSVSELELPTEGEGGQMVLLKKEKLSSERLHVLTPALGLNPPHDDMPDQQDEELPPAGSNVLNPTPPSAPLAPLPLPAEEVDAGKISHIPYSFAVTERQTIIQAVVSSMNEIKEVYCVVMSGEEGKPAIVLMTKVADTRYTYEGRLPAQPAGSKTLRYTVVARDTQGKELRSKEFITPLTSSTIVPGWQQ